jgi:hypothetical protein
LRMEKQGVETSKKEAAARNAALHAARGLQPVDQSAGGRKKKGRKH